MQFASYILIIQKEKKEKKKLDEKCIRRTLLMVGLLVSRLDEYSFPIHFDSMKKQGNGMCTAMKTFHCCGNATSRCIIREMLRGNYSRKYSEFSLSE